MDLSGAAPATFVETLTLHVMVTVSTDAEKLSSFDLTHRGIMNIHCIRQQSLFG